MYLIGSRLTLAVNVCALVAAYIVVAEAYYIVHECHVYWRQDTWAFFAPAVVMFIIRKRMFSFVFLALYAAVAGKMFYQARSIHLEPHACGDRFDGPLDLLVPVFILGVICLVVYVIAALAYLAANNSRNN